jgi:hypothetical protein
MHMMVSTYLRFQADYPTPEPGASGAGEVASFLVAELRAKGFNPSDPEDQEFAHMVRCKSGQYEYEIMIAFDFVDGHTWEISCPQVLGFLSHLFGKTDEKELSTLIEAIHGTMQSNPHVKEMHWHPSYGDKSHDSRNPIYTA